MYYQVHYLLDVFDSDVVGCANNFSMDLRATCTLYETSPLVH